MKLVAILALIPFLSLAASDQVKFENDGVMSFSTGGGSVRYQGKTKVIYPGFQIQSKGQLVQFYCASLSQAGSDQGHMDIKVHPRLGSIVAIGEVTVTLTHVVPHTSIRCKKAVYIHDSGSWLIDGKPWPEEDSAQLLKK